MSEGKPSTGLVIGIILAVVLLCGGGFAVLGMVFFFRAAGTSSFVGPGSAVYIDQDGTQVTYPYSPVLQQFKDAIGEGDTETAYGLVTDDYRSDVSLDTFRAETEAYRKNNSSNPSSIDFGEYAHTATEGELGSGSWKQSVWTENGNANERIDFIEESPGVWRVERWVIE